MKTDTRQQLLELIGKSGGTSPARIAASLKISAQMVHRHLKDLLREGKIQKSGAPPRVLYRLASMAENFHFPAIPAEQEHFINAHYCTVSPTGEIQEGMHGFKQWAFRTRQHHHFTALCSEYVSSLSRLEARHRNPQGLIDALFKIRETFDSCHLDKLYYQAFYSIPKFGKTRIGQQVFLGKSGQDIETIEALAEQCRASLQALIRKHRIECLAFTPHSIPRKISFLKEFQRALALLLPTVTLAKSFPQNIPIAQKSLSKLADRIENARNTLFVITQPLPYKRVLLIDDAVGSGATLNIGAEKLKEAGANFVCGYAICGSLKGFDVISEV